MVLVSILNNRLVKTPHLITTANLTQDQTFCHSVLTLMAACTTGQHTAVIHTAERTTKLETMKILRKKTLNERNISDSKEVVIEDQHFAEEPVTPTYGN